MVTETLLLAATWTEADSAYVWSQLGENALIIFCIAGVFHYIRYRALLTKPERAMLDEERRYYEALIKRFQRSQLPSVSRMRSRIASTRKKGGRAV